MKPSGLAWAPTIPERWTVKKLGFLASLKSGDSITADDIREEGPYAVYGGNGLRGYTDRFTHDGHYVLIGRQGALCGNINYAAGQFWASEHAVVVTPREVVAVHWLGELLRGMDLNQYSASAAQPGLAVETIAELRVPIPPLDEQRAIAKFVNHETARIDRLVAAKERLLGLSGEKRRALITRAVTRGLKPAAPFRHSGVRWLGGIPAHWDVVALRFLVEFGSGATPDTDRSDFWEGSIPWVSPKDMKQEVIEDAQDHVSELAISESGLRRYDPGAVLIVVRGMILAHSFPVALNSVTVTINQDVKALRCGARVLPGLLRDYLRGHEEYIVGLADSSAHGTRKLETEVLGRLEVAVPPLEEQEQITAYVKARTSRLDAIRVATETSIRLLKERRSALIMAAVTGQLDLGATT
jgi:type I restriction enzyme S subunit